MYVNVKDRETCRQKKGPHKFNSQLPQQSLFFNTNASCDLDSILDK